MPLNTSPQMPPKRTSSSTLTIPAGGTGVSQELSTRQDNDGRHHQQATTKWSDTDHCTLEPSGQGASVYIGWSLVRYF